MYLSIFAVIQIIQGYSRLQKQQGYAASRSFKYRNAHNSKRARLSDETWRFAQSFSGKWMIIAGLAMIGAAFIPHLIGEQNVKNFFFSRLIWSVTSFAICAVAPFLLTEITLKQRFDTTGMPAK